MTCVPIFSNTSWRQAFTKVLISQSLKHRHREIPRHSPPNAASSKENKTKQHPTAHSTMRLSTLLACFALGGVFAQPSGHDKHREEQRKIAAGLPKPMFVSVALPPAVYLTPPPGVQKAEVIRVCKSQLGTDDLEKCAEAMRQTGPRA